MSAKEAQFLYTTVLDGRGGGREIDPSELEQWSADDGPLWLHMDSTDPGCAAWIRSQESIDDVIADTLLADETRPRSVVTSSGLLVVLRGVNTNPGADPEDMVSVRIWIERDRLISSRRRRLLSVVDVHDALLAGNGPTTRGEFLTRIIEGIADRIGNFVDGIEDHISEVEDRLAVTAAVELRGTIAELRRQIASVRRFLAPQRDALDRLMRYNNDLLTETETHRLREEADRITRHLEDLDLARERTLVLQEELQGRLAEEQNARMYVLSVVAAIFLPLTFVTGLLGMNVGGLPGTENPQGFVVAMIIMLAATGGLVAYFRWKRWI